MFSGTLSFNNLRLQPRVLDQLGLPVTVVHGYVSKLVVHIPWKHLFPVPSQQVRIEIENVLLVIAAKVFRSEDEAEFAKQKVDAKKKALTDLNNKDKGSPSIPFRTLLSTVVTISLYIHVLQTDKKEAEDKSAKSKDAPSFVNKLIASIINNLQLTIDTVHVRFEDELSSPERLGGFAIGITLHNLRFESVDENGTSLSLIK